MNIFLLFAIMFLLMGIFGLIYLFKKINDGVKYFVGESSKKKTWLITCGLFILTLLPAFFSLLKWFVILVHLIVFLLLTDAVAGVLKRWKYPKWLKTVYHTGTIAILLTVIVSCYATYNMYHIVRTEYNVDVNKKTSQDLTLVMIADLHYGISIDAEQLQSVADSIEKESPDAVILCGDIVDESTTEDGMKEAFSILGGIESKFGVYYVYGNHDKSRYTTRANYSELQLAKTITDSRITILEDQTVTFNDDIIIVGRADKSDTQEKRKSIKDLLDGFDQSKAIIVADHQPSDYDNLEKESCDLVISGHTHGGQTFPLGFINDLVRFSELNYGYKKQGQLNAVVTSGIAGWGYDMRTEHHSEYVVIHMKGKK